MGIFGGVSTGIAGWVFSWSGRAVITTAIPCVLILGLGYRQATKEPRPRAFLRCARSVALVAAIWLASALLLDAILNFYRVDQLRLYDASSFWTDVRFYLGWSAGLVLAPFPFSTARNGDRAQP